MDSQVVTGVLQTMGVAGAIISVLMGVVAVLSTVIVFQYKHAMKVYGFRLSERDVLNAALTSSTSAIKENAELVEQRNKALVELSVAMRELSGSLEQLRDRVSLQYEFLTREMDRQAQVVSAVAEANRVLSSMTADNRSAIVEFRASLAEIKVGVLDIANRIIRKSSRVNQGGGRTRSK